MINIEFFTSEDGSEITMRTDGQYRVYNESEKEITLKMYQCIEEEFPEAFRALMEVYGRAAHFKYLVVRRFIKCNFSRLDEILDVTHDGTLNLEKVRCPLRGECKFEHIICLPKRSTGLTPAQLRVARLMALNRQEAEIADELFISIETVRKHRKAILRKLGVQNRSGVILWLQKNNIEL